MEWVNLTPHEIALYHLDGVTYIPPSGVVARVAIQQSAPRVNMLGMNMLGMKVQRFPQYGAVESLPPPTYGVVYLVSAMVLARCVGRFDVFAPATGPDDGAIRQNGQVVGVTMLIAAPTGC